MNFTVTGGAGLVGSHIVKRLISDGHDVTVIDNLSRGNVANLKGVCDGIDFVSMDIRERDGLKRALRGTDGVFHQAALAYVPGSYNDTDEYRQVNVTGTENVLQACMELGTKVVYASSSTVYGDVRRVPVREDHARSPINPYGITKLEAELAVERYVRRGARIVALRYFNVVGPGRRPAYSGVVHRFLEQVGKGRPLAIHGDGSQIKDFVFVQDVVRANLAAMTSSVKSGFFNIGSGRPISIADLARLMISISGKGLPKPKYDDPQPGDAKMCVADTTKAGRLLGWKPDITLEEGLRSLLEHP